MKKTINAVLAVCALILAVLCWRSIQDDINFDKEVAYREALVKAKLLQIKDAEEAYKQQHHEGAYCADWDVLTEFVRNGRLPVVIKEGVLSDEQMEKGLTEAKAAAIINGGDAKAIAEYKLEGFRRDTIWVSLIDSLYKGQAFNVDSLRYIPFAEGDTFEIIACPNTTKSGAIIQVMECNAPISSYLKGMGKLGDRMIKNTNIESEETGRYAGLRIGEAGNGWNNNAGNWE
ncbi:MAG: hypothetical protein IKL71_01485 [Bacteroidaceae bacterium]|nr:hypothetical protein [Bacteroidaceae bacterium]